MNQLNNPLWPFPVHNGQRTEASKVLLRKVDKTEGSFPLSLQAVVEYPDRVTDTRLEEDALM